MQERPGEAIAERNQREGSQREGVTFARRPQNPRKRTNYKGPPKKVQTPKKRRLNLRKTIEFKYELNKVLEDLPETITGTLKGSIYAKADREDQNSALDFIASKVEDKTIDQETADELSRLVRKYCTYR